MPSDHDHGDTPQDAAEPGVAAGYNVFAISLAAGALAGVGFVLPPAVGALLMSASTVVVAFNAQLLHRVNLRRSAPSTT